MSFSTGLHWSFIAGHDEYWSQEVKVMATDRQVHYLCLPLLVHLDLSRFGFGLGYQLGTPLIESGTFYRYPYANGFGEYSEQEVEDLGLKSTDFGLVGEFDYQISDRVGVGARYYYGLQDIKDHSDGILWPLMNEQLVLTISYRILPKPKAKTEEAPTEQAQPSE
jgi:hypothetical protein